MVAAGTPTGSMLVVGHERHIVRLIEVNLQRQGWVVAKAFTLAEAGTQLDVATFALLVIDSPMPDGDVGSFLGKVKGDPRHVGMRIVVMGRTDEDDPGDPPSDRFLTKPFHPLEILRKA